MKISIKITVLLIASFVIVAVLYAVTSIFILLNNQKDNQNMFKNEFLEMSIELIQNSSALFYRLLDHKIEENPDLTLDEIIHFFNDIDPYGENIVIREIAEKKWISGYNRTEIISLLNSSVIEHYMHNFILTSQTNFSLDNYDFFLSKPIGTIEPIRAHFRIYESLGLIIGYGEVQISGAIRLEYIDSKNADYFRLYLYISIIIFIIAVIFVLLIVIRAMNSLVVSPLELITKGFNKIQEGDFDVNVYINRKDEIGELVEDFNSMADKLKYTLNSLREEVQERKEAEEALADEKERLMVTLRSIGDGVITTDIDANIVIINKVAEVLTGWTNQEAYGLPLRMIFKVQDEKTKRECLNPVEQIIQSGGVIKFINRMILIAKNGTEKIVADSAAPIKDRESNIIGVILVFRDITEQIKMEEEVQKIRTLESIGLLAGGIAHDFNNILTAVLSNTTLLRKSLKSGEIDDKNNLEITENIKEAVLQAKGLTQQLLTFSKGGAPVKQASSISELLKDTVEFSLRGSNIKCEFNLPDDLWSVDIDIGQINQVIQNLILNAVQAMSNGGRIYISEQNINVDKNYTGSIPIALGKYVKIIIRDEGMGISQDNISKIFTPYFTTKKKGNGLGLSITYSIINKHGGHITVESEEGVGTTFCIFLPATSKKTVLIKNDKNMELIIGNGKVLVMDDQEIILKTLKKILSRLGYDAEFSTNGEETIELYKKALKNNEPFDAVILDLTIPGGIGGKETIKKLLEIDKNIKAIVSSGYSNDPVMSCYKKYGFKAVIAKPYTMENLGYILKEVITDK